jgi:hypothetical protein
VRIGIRGVSGGSSAINHPPVSRGLVKTHASPAFGSDLSNTGTVMVDMMMAGETGSMSSVVVGGGYTREVTRGIVCCQVTPTRFTCFPGFEPPPRGRFEVILCEGLLLNTTNHGTHHELRNSLITTIGSGGSTSRYPRHGLAATSSAITSAPRSR